MSAPPVLAVADVDAAARWWAEQLAFEVEFRNRGPGVPTNYAVVRRDDVEVHLARRDEVSDRRRSEIVVTVLDLGALASELVERGVGVNALPSGSLLVRDPDGNRVVFVMSGQSGDQTPTSRPR